MKGVLQTWWAFLRQFVFAWLVLTRPTRKLAALIHHITDTLPDGSDHCLLRIVLMAYLCEVESYKFYGKTMTGATWIHGEEGPEPRELPFALGWLVSRGVVSLHKT